MLYLHKLDIGKINSEQEISYSDYVNQVINKRTKIDKGICKALIKKYYLDAVKLKPSYRHYKCFIKMLFSSLETFSESIYFNVKILMEDHRINPYLQLDKVRESFFKICIRNSL